jgi:6-phosphogluconate dehydrogenase
MGHHMQLAMVGLGRMGANLVRRVMAAGHDCVVFDTDPNAVAELAGDGAVGCDSLDDMVSKLQRPRAVGVMVPAGGPTEHVVTALASSTASWPPTPKA